MNNKNKDPKLIIVFILLIMAILLIYFSYIIKVDRKLTIVEQALKDTFITTEKIALAPFNMIIDQVVTFKNYQTVLKENKKLKSDVQKYDLLKAENKYLQKEFDKLKSLLEIDTSLSDYTYLNASVIKRNVGYWYNELTIDKGSQNGVKTGMGVITNEGLIGRVVKTTRFSSSVKLLTDGNPISVGIDISQNIINGVITKYDYETNYLIVEGISEYIDIPIDSIVYTTGFNSQIPSGILIGYVKEIDKDEYGLSKIIKIKLSADINNLKYVTILKRDDMK